MPEIEISKRALEAIIANMERLQASPVIDEGLAWLKCHRTRLDSPRQKHLVFRHDMPGYLTIGRLGEERQHVQPPIAGLGYAWRVFLAGATAQHVLQASMLLDSPGKRPDNALRNALSAAADWLEYQAHCPELAAAVRGITVGRDNTIHYDPAKGARIELF